MALTPEELEQIRAAIREEVKNTIFSIGSSALLILGGIVSILGSMIGGGGPFLFLGLGLLLVGLFIGAQRLQK